MFAQQRKKKNRRAVKDAGPKLRHTLNKRCGPIDRSGSRCRNSSYIFFSLGDHHHTCSPELRNLKLLMPLHTTPAPLLSSRLNYLETAVPFRLGHIKAFPTHLDVIKCTPVSHILVCPWSMSDTHPAEMDRPICWKQGAPEPN